MKKISMKYFMSLSEGSEVLSQDAYGKKVLRLKDGRIIKLFRIKRLFSSTRIFPYARRFKTNAEKLMHKGIPSVREVRLFKIPEMDRTAVLYYPLEGETLRGLICHKEFDENRVKALGTFVSHLHEEGVYFRSIHFGNIIVLNDGKFGLIDVADMRIFKRPLGIKRRIRNFKHLLRYKEDKDAIRPFKWAFIKGYLSNCHISSEMKQRLKGGIETILAQDL